MSEFRTESSIEGGMSHATDATGVPVDKQENTSSTNDSSTEEGDNIAIKHVCASPGCGKPASMACPTCIKLGVGPSRFCGQECFTKNWAEHKSVHPKKQKSLLPPEFRNYVFSGTLRPALKTPQRTVPDHIGKPDYATHPQGVSYSEQLANRNKDIIKVYTAEEMVGIRKACIIGREVLDIAGKAVGVGVTTEELDNIVFNATVERGAYPSPLNYYNFPKSVCTSVNEVICHGIPDARPLVEGDIVNLDISVYKDGFHADLNETFFVGNVDENTHRLVQCAYECLAAAIAICKPGTLYRDCGEAIDKVARKYKCSIVTSYCGHGVGSEFHCSPNIPHYPKNKAKGRMQVGHVFTIEPMINLGGSRDILWPDDWTAASADGSRSSQFEHTMVVTETGVELLTARPGQPTDRMIWDPSFFQR